MKTVKAFFRENKKIWIVILLWCLFIVSGNISIKVHAKEGAVQTVKVGFFALPGYHEIVDNTKRQGYGVKGMLI